MIMDIDIVITWVDGSDKEWIKEKNKYLLENEKVEIDATETRYRDWGNLKYLFRGIEKFAPWVRKVFFVTCGQKPDWLNTKNEKLVCVDHKDYIPRHFLPTFSSHPIELNMHRIKGLSEHFIYFNDDMMIINPLKIDDFFSKEGLPKYLAIERASACIDMFADILTNNIVAINSKYNKSNVKKRNKMAWYFSGLVPFVLNNFYDRTAKDGFVGFQIQHLPSPFLKSEIEKCWEEFPDVLSKTSSHKFRSIEDVNQYLFIEHLLCNGKFKSKKFRRGGTFLSFKECGLLCNAIKKQRYKLICLFDDVTQENFEETRDKINSAFEEILPNKSSFEI